MAAGEGERAGWIRLEPAVQAVLRPPGGGAGSGQDTGALRALATALSAEAVLIRWQPAPGAAAPPGPAPGSRWEVALATAEGELVLPAVLAGAAAGDAGVLLRLEQLEPARAAALERFITRHRKADHLRICRDEDVAARGVRTGLERWRLPHLALPELDKRAIDVSVRLLGRTLRAPLLISCMTGGSELAKVVNQRLARVAQRHGLALGLGSERALLADPSLLDTYAVRELCPDVLLFGNLGAVQLNYGLDAQACARAVELVGADALVLHCNPLQEAVQPEGDVDFSGLRAKIAALAEQLPFPVLLKEVGNGIGPEIARWVATTRLAGVDVAGAGGTSWSRVESYRAADPVLAALGESFAGWGVPTAVSLQVCRAALPDRIVIASGGITDGIQAAKAIALGADLVGIARPFLQAAVRSEEQLEQLVRLLIEQLRVAMFCTGCRDIAALRGLKLEREEP